MTPEDRIHLALLLALGAANLTLFSRGPSASSREPAAARALAGAQPVEVTPPELQAAIDRLEQWLAPRRAAGAAGSADPRALLALGPTREERTQPERWLRRVLGDDTAGVWLAPVATLASSLEPAPQVLARALVVLLEAGVPLERTLASSSAEKAPGVTLSELTRRVLDGPGGDAARTERNPWQLDLLSLAVLGGLSQYRERLGQLTHERLRWLELEQRSRAGQPGAGELDAATLEQLARSWRPALGSERPEAPELRWSASVFRATAVLAEPDLREQARRHLNVLLTRYQSERALLHHLRGRAHGAAERRSLQIEALERLGHLEEALYNAHLTFQDGSGAGPSAEMARVMRCAARDLIEQLQELEARDFELPRAASGQAQDSLLRAAVQALRGLRSARVAG